MLHTFFCPRFIRVGRAFVQAVKAQARSGLYKSSGLKGDKVGINYTNTSTFILPPLQIYWESIAEITVLGKPKEQNVCFNKTHASGGFPQLQVLRLRESQQILQDNGLPAADLRAPVLPVLVAAVPCAYGHVR